MARRNPALDRLDVLVGRWQVQPKVAGVGVAHAEHSWVEGGLYLRQYTDVENMPVDDPWREVAPFPTTSLFGYDDTADEFTMLYADTRGVHRVYRMTFGDGDWRIWRDAPGFNQRFIGVFLDADTIDARWEMSEDLVEWRVDFGLTSTRLSGGSPG